MSKIKKRWTLQEKIFVVLFAIVFILLMLSVSQKLGWLIPTQGQIFVSEKRIDLDSLSMEQKIAQMLVVQGNRNFLKVWQNLQIGGIHLFALQNEHIYNNTILDFQDGMTIPFFVTVDLEGCVSPFNHIKSFTSASDIKSSGDAFEKGHNDGKFLKKLGFSINFAPVVDLDDNIWKCRNFPGTETDVAEKAEAYILGMQDEGIIATAKHYPGKTLVVKDPHKYLVIAEINKKDILPYQYLSEKGKVKAIMVSHIISSGEVESEGVPAVVSENVISGLRKDFEGLIVTDEIHMLGLKNFFDTVDQMYIAVFRAGNDVILNFDRDPNEVYRMIRVVAKAVDEGEISEEKIDASVTRILKAKGFIVE